MSRIFGGVRQNGYVVRDIEAAMATWLRHGVGPWFFVSVVPVEGFTYRGEPSSMTMSVALANSGDLQLELIAPLDDEPSMYRDFLASGREGFQHVSYWTEDYDTLYADCIARGFAVGHEGSIGGGRFAYFDTEATGTVFEISDVSGPKGQFFVAVREAAANWDGSEPIRRLA